MYRFTFAITAALTAAILALGVLYADATLRGRPAHANPAAGTPAIR